jgi:hypothetical protein
MKHVNIVLPDSTHKTLTKLAQSKGVDLGQYCSARLTELAEQEASQPVHSERHSPDVNEQVKEIELIREIIACLKQSGGAAPKIAVEKALFEKFNDVFKSSYYSELVGGGIPRWKKNVQFARNTARNMGLIKPPDESGRGNWELTEKGRQWKFDSE